MTLLIEKTQDTQEAQKRGEILVFIFDISGDISISDTFPI